MLSNFCVLNFRVKIFSWSRIPTKNFLTVLNRLFYVPKFNESGTRLRMPRKLGACCVRGYHAAVVELLARERELKNAVGTHCGNKDRRIIGQ